MDLSRRQFLQVAGLGALSVAGASFLTGCGGSGGSDGGSSSVANKDKPVVFYNRQPSNSKTGKLDDAALKFNDKTYYVGFDATQGAELQGQMVKDYIEKNIDKIDRNGDGIIGYVLAIGDVGHNDSIARTRGVRKVLGTAVEASDGIVSDPVGNNGDGKSDKVQDGKLTINGKDYTIRELASDEMKNSAGATWDAATAGDKISAWSSDLGDKIDVVVSNNDGMGMAMYNKWAEKEGVPVFGYDANSDAVEAIGKSYGGTISQAPDIQAYLTLRLLRNGLDGVDIETGISKEDDAGNKLEDDAYKYVEKERSYYAMNQAVTKDNYKDYLDSTKIMHKATNALDTKKSPEKKVWLSTYNSADNFLGSTYKPLLKKFATQFNLKVDYIDGDGQSESTITNKLGNPSEYDAFAINMVKTDNAATYTSILSQ